MRFALVGDKRTSSPLPGLTGYCPVCSSSMIAKCGNERVHHWAHRVERTCDSWWEPETEWHRSWKNRFPSEWQEVIRHDAAGEKHIADVQTAHGLTIEFQHSHLRPEERTCREAAYGNMIWVVDGGRLSRDLPRFEEGAKSFRLISPKGIYLCPFPAETFPKQWLDCQTPVCFDFGAHSAGGHISQLSRVLWCLLPGRVFGQAIVIALAPTAFARICQQRPKFLPVEAILNSAANFLELEGRRRAQAFHRQRAEEAKRMFVKRSRWKRSRRGRRF